MRTTGALILPSVPGEAARHLMELASSNIASLQPTTRTTARLLADGA